MAARLAEIINPTGREHTPTPWAAGVAGIEGFPIEACGKVIAQFRRSEDRDLALYFVNTHAAVIGLLRSMAGQFRFIAAGTDDDAMRHIAGRMGELAQIYGDLFAALGDTSKLQKNEGGSDGNASNDQTSG